MERARNSHCHWLEQTPRTSSTDAEHEKRCIAQFLYILPLRERGKGKKSVWQKTLHQIRVAVRIAPYQGIPWHNSVKIFLHPVRCITSPSQRPKDTFVTLGD